MELNERKMRILQAIIDDYVASGMPIGSRTISRMWGGALSAATIRNEMSDLEEMGLLQQPHTSAGRVPSDLAYRLYVDQLLQVSSLSGRESEQITSYFKQRVGEIDEIVARSARALSDMTQYVSMVLLPQLQNVTFREIRLIPVTNGRALAVIVTTEGLVKDFMIDVPESVDERHLDMLSNALTAHMRGRTRSEMGEAIEAIRKQINLHEDAFVSLLNALNKQPAEHMQLRNLVFDGTQNLFMHPEFADPQRARSFLASMEKRELLNRMVKQAQRIEFTISIGRENEDEGLQDSSVVTATYFINSVPVGSFGVIGPMRMDYARVVAIVDDFQRQISHILSGYGEEDADE